MELDIPFRVVSGSRIDLANLRPEDIKIEDIACALSKICRFSGHISEFYSVAQHATMVATLVHPSLRFPALHHDDSEAYLGDVSRHLKHSQYLSGYRDLEDRATLVIEEALGLKLTLEDREEIKAADDCVAVFEQFVMRYRRPWLGAEHVRMAVREGFIKGAHVSLACAMASRVPASWVPFIPLYHMQAEQLFLTCHGAWS
jgi:hypothetical protein